MTTKIQLLVLLACPLLLTAPALSMAEEIDKPGARKCIPTRRLTSTAVIDDRNVLFYMIGKTVYRNILPDQCKGLTSKAFTYASMAGSLCNFDTIRVIKGGHSGYGPLCRLGNFYAVTDDDIPEIIALLNKKPAAKQLPSAEVEEVTVKTNPGADQN
jgi:hypothetical protein